MQRREFVAGVMVTAACGPKRTGPYPGYAFVANEEARTVVALDLARFRVARQIVLDAAPSSVAVHPAKPAAYVLTPQSGTVHLIDPKTLRATRRLQVHTTADHMLLALDAITPAAQRGLWVLCREGRRLVQINTDRFEIQATIPLPERPVSFDIAHYLPAAAVSYGAHGSVGVVDLSRGQHRSVPVSAAVGEVHFQSNGEQVLAANLAETAVSVLRTRDGQVVTHLPLAVRPEHFCESPDGGEWYVSGPGADAIVIVDPYHTQILATLLAGHGPRYMAAADNPHYLFVSNPLTNDVTIFDIAFRQVIAVAPVGQEPGPIGLTPDGQYGLVLNQASGDVAVLRIATLTANKYKRAALFTMIPVGAKPVSVAVQTV